VAVLPLDGLDGTRQMAGVACERVYVSVGGGLCLERSGRFPVRYEATVLDAHLRPVRSIRVPGIPSRTRVSADGRWGTTTTFVSGHSYAALGAFSTHAMIIDMATGRKVIDNLEDLPVTRDGAPMESVDHNLWGVTFAPDRDTFYATLATQGTTYLVRGSISGRRLEVLHENVECPSVSPDGTRVAYKKRTGSYALWHVTVLDLATMRETSLAELDPIDDQIEWLDDDTVLYHNGGGISAVPADGSGAPRVFLADAGSPSVVRPAR
jgi:Tol biopolymer transport system component